MPFWLMKVIKGLGGSKNVQGERMMNLHIPSISHPLPTVGNSTFIMVVLCSNHKSFSSICLHKSTCSEGYSLLSELRGRLSRGSAVAIRLVASWYRKQEILQPLTSQLIPVYDIPMLSCVNFW